LTTFEREFHSLVVVLVGRWWNGRWGRLARRDIWLKHDRTWRVEARQGDGDSRLWSRDYPTEAEARNAIAAMIDRTGGQGQWRELTTGITRNDHQP
jgi:hypothetical protein